MMMPVPVVTQWRLRVILPSVSVQEERVRVVLERPCPTIHPPDSRLALHRAPPRRINEHIQIHACLSIQATACGAGPQAMTQEDS